MNFLQLPVSCCHMTKIIQFRNKLGVLYSRKNNPWIGVGEEVPLKQQGTLPEGYGARASSMELEEASGNRAGWLGGCDFHIRRAGPIL